jgi:hypothetical protein
VLPAHTSSTSSSKGAVHARKLASSSTSSTSWPQHVQQLVA